MFRLSYIFTAIFSLVAINSVAGIKFSDRVDEHMLSNGLKVILVEDKRSSSVVNSVWYKVGSSDEVIGKTGISHILEHMMFKGTKNLLPGEFSRIVKKMGGSENAFTSKDFTGYYQKIHPDNLEKCIELESDRMRNLKLTNKEISSELKVVQEERRLRTDDNPVSKTFEKIMLNAFGMNQYGIPIIGTMNDIKNITKKDLQDWYDMYYQPNNAIVIIAGNFDKTNALNLVKKYYGKIKNTSEISRNKLSNKFITEPYFDIVDNVSKPIIFVSYKKNAFEKENLLEAYALDLFVEIMDGGYSSRLTKALVERDKIALDVFISVDIYNKYSNLITVGGTSRGKVSIEDFKGNILSQFSEDSINSITYDELNSAKSRIKAKNIFKFDSVFYQGMQIGMLETKDISWKVLDQYASDIQKINLDQVKSVAKKYFLTNDVLVTVLKPQK